MAPGNSKLPSAPLVESELTAICSHPLFLNAPGAASLLRYLVQHHLSGNEDELRETAIGVGFYGRDAAYDPKLDAIVRVNATRLRNRLEQYYATEPESEVRIVLPAGGYVPLYEEHAAVELSATAPEVPGQSTEEALPQPFSASQPLSGAQSAFVQAGPVVRRRSVWHWLAPVSLLTAVAAGLTVASLHRRSETQAPERWTAQPFSSGNFSHQFADISPDSNTVAMVTRIDAQGKKLITLQRFDSDESHPLFSEAADQTRPAWSPDGKRIAYERMSSPAFREVVVITLGDDKEESLAELPAAPTLWLCQNAKLTWSRDGKTIYTSAPEALGQPCNLVSIDVATHAVRRLETSPAGFSGDLEATLSPDGKSLAFLRNASYQHSDVFQMTLPAGPVRQITHDNADILGLAWSHDEKSLIVSSNRAGGHQGLWRVPLQGEPVPMLSGMSPAPSFPAVSRDGARILVTQFHEVSSIWKRSGNKTVNVINNGAMNLTTDVSPDGRYVLFDSRRSGHPVAWISRADGSEARRLLRNKDIEAFDARWSPDGRHIAFECNTGATSHICLTDINGSAMTELTHSEFGDFRPSWSHDSGSVYYISSASGTREIYRQSLKGGPPVQITHSGSERAEETRDGRWLVVTCFAVEPCVLALPRKKDGSGGWDESAQQKIPLTDRAHALSSWDVDATGILMMMEASPDHWTLIHQDLAGKERRTEFELEGYSPETGFLVSSSGEVFFSKLENDEGLQLLSPEPPSTNAGHDRGGR